MIDYLSNLVARHLGTIEPVQPRLASRFEPPPSAARLPVEQETWQGAQTPDAHETRDQFDIEIQTPAGSLTEMPPHTPPRRSVMPPLTERDDVPTPTTPSRGLTREPDTTRNPVLPPRANSTGEHTPADNASSVVEPIQVKVIGQSTTKDAAPPERTLDAAPSSSTPRRPPDPAAPAGSSDKVSDPPPHTLPPARSEREDEIQARRGVGLLPPARASQSLSAPHVEPPHPVFRHERETPGLTLKPTAEQQQQASPTIKPLVEGQQQTSLTIKPSLKEQQPSLLTPQTPLVASRPADRPPQRGDAPGASRPDSHEEGAARPVVRPPEPAHGVVAEPRTTRSAEPSASAQAGSKETPEAAPVINVTIGRIEVRAVPAPVAPRRAGTPAPPMNLDDYLRRRAGGGGR